MWVGFDILILFAFLLVHLTSSCAHHLITVPTFALTVYHSFGLLLQTYKTHIFHTIPFLTPQNSSKPGRRIVFLASGLHWSWTCNGLTGTVVCCFSFFFSYFLFPATCAWLSWPQSAFQSTLNSSIVSYCCNRSCDSSCCGSVWSVRQFASFPSLQLLSADRLVRPARSSASLSFKFQVIAWRDVTPIWWRHRPSWRASSSWIDETATSRCLWTSKPS